MADFSEILNQKAADAEPPKPLPAGTYTAMILAHDEVESTKKGTPGIQWTLQMVAPIELDDEDEEVPENLTEKKLKFTHWLVESTMWRFAAFFEDVLGLEKGDKSYNELLEEAAGIEFGLTIQHELGENNGKEYKIGTIADSGFFRL